MFFYPFFVSESQVIEFIADSLTKDLIASQAFVWSYRILGLTGITQNLLCLYTCLYYQVNDVDKCDLTNVLCCIIGVICIFQQ